MACISASSNQILYLRNTLLLDLLICRSINLCIDIILNLMTHINPSENLRLYHTCLVCYINHRYFLSLREQITRAHASPNFFRSPPSGPIGVPDRTTGKRSHGSAAADPPPESHNILHVLEGAYRTEKPPLGRTPFIHPPPIQDGFYVVECVPMKHAVRTIQRHGSGSPRVRGEFTNEVVYGVRYDKRAASYLNALKGALIE